MGCWQSKKIPLCQNLLCQGFHEKRAIYVAKVEGSAIPVGEIMDYSVDYNRHNHLHTYWACEYCIDSVPYLWRQSFIYSPHLKIE